MPGNGRKSIGFILGGTEGPSNFERELWLGAHDAAVARDFDLLVLVGGSFLQKAATGKPAAGNVIYDLYSPGVVDVVTLATITACLGLDEAGTERFVQRFNGLPFVMIRGLPGKYKSLVDNASGVYEAVCHLIKVHGRKRIGFLRGPIGSDSDERFEAYRRALADNGLEYDERLTYVGDFLADSGTAFAAELLEVRKVEFDGMAAANDGMAFGFIQGLHARGKRVPFDISVIGFDDIESAAFFNPPLTTVRQPIYRQSYQAVEMACDLLAGKPVERERALPTENVYRQSCGCLPQSIDDRRIPVGSQDASLLGKWRERRRELMARIVERSHLIPGELPAAEDFAARISAVLRGNTGAESVDSLLAYVESALSGFADDESSTGRWLAFMRETRACMIAMVDTADKAPAAEELSCRLELIAGEMRLRAAGMRALATDRLNTALKQLTIPMAATFELEKLLSLLDSSLPLNGISGYSLAFFDGESAGSGPPPRLRQVGAFVDGQSIRPKSDAEHFPSAQYFKRELFSSKRRSMVVEPLTFGDALIGIVAFEVHTRNGASYDSIARHLSSSLMGSRFLAESVLSHKALVERGERIQRLVLPMIESLEKVAALIAEKSRATAAIAAAAKRSQQQLDGTIATLSAAAAGVSSMAALIQAIDEISITVSLVSLNASIEASHAGEFGRGFAIIAKEIKKHAESTQAKASGIMRAIQDVLEKVDCTTKAGQESLESYREEEKGVNLLLETFTAITGDMGALAEAGRKILQTMRS
jgi:hypothetical protein